MRSFILLSAIGQFCVSHAHMIMFTPTPFNNETIDNSPLLASGANYPCKSTGAANFYDRTGISNVMAIGQTQTLSFRGSAVHGGGSCQLAITTDKAPTPSTTWQVIQSIEGGCPSTDGNGPSTYPFSIPSGVAAGDYIFAWTWISKLAGQPEYYMNCAPITVTGGSTKKRSPSPENSDLVERAAALPNLAVYNLASVNSCKTSPGTDPVFPDPGTNVVKPGKTPSYANPVGTNCFPIGGSGSSSSNDSTAAVPANSAPAAPAAPSSSSANNGQYTGIGASSTAAVAPAANTGGVFAPGASSAASSPSNGTTLTTLSSVAATSLAAATSTAAASSLSAPTLTPSSGSSSSNSTSAALTGACSTEGMWNCLGGTSFQRCASGEWSAVMAMPGGTSCTPGQSETLFARRSVRRFAKQRFV